MLLRRLWKHGHAAVRSFSTAKESSKQKTFTQLVCALQVFREENGHFVVPADHEIILKGSSGATKSVCDTTIPLGRKLQGLIRKLGHLSPSERAQLTAIDFPIMWQAYHLREVVMPALAAYRRVHNHLRIPQAFVVPPGDAKYPPISWGLRLGSRVNHLRRQHASDLLDPDDVDALDAIGFIWHAHADRLHSLTLPALAAFKAIHGHVLVPVQFQVPSDDAAWPVDVLGFHLGHALIALRAAHQKGQLDASVGAALTTLGLPLGNSRLVQKWHQRVFPALQEFVASFGHCDVPQHFIVTSPTWPDATHALPLGRLVRDMRHLNLFAGVYDKAALDLLGFLWTRNDKVAFQVHHRVLPALAVFRAQYDHAFVPASFVVPASSPWPPLAHGFHLGGWIARRRLDLSSLPHALQFLLEEAGVVWRHFDARFDNVVLPAFQIYADIHGTCADMSTAFYVPEEDPWPPHLWGLNLGGALWHIRNGDSFVSDPKKRRALTRCGVV
ncbi:Aste57867_23979 [Aphanomyces stellatus]|uniref:Aste57867_23979 protein n=1 Tax=Aphanomyces stellatus TaxID=120398 RepID=A0A485LTJ7_9STRA|nr:hypothetical protein As57867_023906 [Aphanomyces stellatus]VFU00622.1 Aste57867_23979 [Aphanomyces stellatus]